MDFAQIFSHPVVIASLFSAAAAARTDYEAFKSWDEWRDIKTYKWKTALWRWFQGAVIGAVGASAIGTLLG